MGIVSGGVSAHLLYNTEMDFTLGLVTNRNSNKKEPQLL